MKDCVTWMYLPITDRWVFTGEKTIHAPVGVLTSNYNPTIIQDIIPGSRAEKIGLAPGDQILKADMPISSMKYGRKFVKKDVKKKGWAVVSYYPDQVYSIEILRNGNKMKFNIQPASLKISRSYYATSN